ncbi:hypothetical protein H0H92_014039 [Tricholoma furcatifolium]|nr:hypothetical protein H0H92_014039 [Tricholoma furcatifolium]
MSQQEETYVLTGSIKVIDRFFDLPLDYSEPDGRKIRVFARSMIPLDKAKTVEEESKLPYRKCRHLIPSKHQITLLLQVVFLQGNVHQKNVCDETNVFNSDVGGPGFEVDLDSGYISLATATLWLDPRGTGLSTPFSANLVEHWSDEEIFQYLKHFRADNIGEQLWRYRHYERLISVSVRDCESIRKILLGSKPNEEDRKWTILGQSFGGFCCLTYLSFYPEGLKEVFICGGLAPLVDHPDDVYRALEKRVLARNAVFYEKYPGDVKRVRDILSYLDQNLVTLPSGGTLTPNRFLHLGLKFGSQGGIDGVHQIVLRATNDLNLFGKLSRRLLQNIEQEQGLDGNPIYAVLHEPIYCQGDPDRATDVPPTGLKLTAQQMFPDMMDDYSGLRPLKGAAQLLAEYQDWPKLYDLKQLAQNTVKVTSATYVDFDFAQATASSVKNLEQYISNQHHHSALRGETEVIIEKLFRVSKREYD